MLKLWLIFFCFLCFGICKFFFDFVGDFFVFVEMGNFEVEISVVFIMLKGYGSRFDECCECWF